MEPKSLMASSLLGVAAGIRSMTPIAAVSWAAARGRWSFGGAPVGKLADRRVAILLATSAAGEIIVDKLPQVPARTALPVWLWRVGVGGLLGGATGMAADEPAAPGAILGAGAAAASTYVSYRARIALQERGRLADPVAALVGDVSAVALSLAAVFLVRRERRTRLARWKDALSGRLSLR